MVALFVFGAVLFVYMLLLVGTTSAQNVDGMMGGTTGGMTVGTSRAAQSQYDGGLPEPAPTEGCANPEQVVQFQGTDNRRTDPFAVSGDVLRIRFSTEATDPDSIDDNLVVSVLKANRDYVDGVLILDPGDGSRNVLLPGPGNYFLEIEAGDVRYELSVDDCGSVDTGDGDTQRGDADDNNAGGLGDGTIEDSDDPGDVIQGTVPKKKMPYTGGLPLIGLAILCVAFLGTGLSILGFEIRRRP